ncbi:hypothetical protein [Serratia marcescens]|uniref:hypothetical protein n=1 Tax=Serratia marcescens TaxID=615 RepID=UPI00111C9212|nr:hypothetical protein [Serratia marcescens]UJA56316.1 hypothetical protein L1F17_10625 [Serratia marcescens]
MLKKNKKLLVNVPLLVATTGMSACAAVSLTHANGSAGESITHADVQPSNTVVLTYPGGGACIDTHPDAGTSCTGQ